MEQTIDIQCLTKARYLYRPGKEGGRLILLLHGYMSTAQRMWDRFSEHIREEDHLLALQGPYPLPVKKEEEYYIGYSWFFFDPFTQSYFVRYDVCQDYVEKSVEALGLSHLEKLIVGYSQGGYASVHVAANLKNVSQVIGINSRFVMHDLELPATLTVNALHGDADDVVEMGPSKKSFDNLPDTIRGEYHVFPGCNHKPSPEMIEKVVSLVNV